MKKGKFSEKTARMDCAAGRAGLKSKCRLKKGCVWRDQIGRAHV